MLNTAQLICGGTTIFIAAIVTWHSLGTIQKGIALFFMAMIYVLVGIESESLL